MFITVLYGDKQRSLFNIQCKTVALLTCMKVKCSCEHEAEIDLANLNGKVMNLQCHSGGAASDVLSQREVYILINVRRSSDPSDPVHTSLLHNCDLNDPLVLAKLQNEETERKQCASGELSRSSRTLTSSVSNQITANSWSFAVFQASQESSDESASQVHRLIRPALTDKTF